jgi:hypothetical protein
MIVDRRGIMVTTKELYFFWAKNGDLFDKDYGTYHCPMLDSSRILCLNDSLLVSWHRDEKCAIAYDRTEFWGPWTRRNNPGTRTPPSHLCLMDKMILMETVAETGELIGLQLVGPLGYYICVFDRKHLCCRKVIAITKDFEVEEPTKIIVSTRHAAVKYGKAGLSIWNHVTKKRVRVIRSCSSDELFTDSNCFLYCVPNYKGCETSVFSITLQGVDCKDVAPVRLLHLPFHCMQRIAIFNTRLFAYNDAFDDCLEMVVADVVNPGSVVVPDDVRVLPWNRKNARQWKRELL